MLTIKIPNKITIDVKEYVNAYFEAWSAGNPEQVATFFSQRAAFEDLAFAVRHEGTQQINDFATSIYDAAPDFTMKPQSIVVNGSKAAVTWLMSGTHSGDLFGLPATGKSFQVRGSSMIKIHNDKIQSVTNYWNPLTFTKAVNR